MSMNRYDSDPALDAEMKRLNQAVDDAVAARTTWMDAHMADYARHRLGDVLYNLENGQRVGVVSSLYRFHADDQRFDRSMSVDYRIQVDDYGTCFDSTSSQPLRRLGTVDELAADLERRAAAARRAVDAGGDKP